MQRLEGARVVADQASEDRDRRKDAPARHQLESGTLAECDRVGDGQADHSHKHRRHGANVQAVTDPDGRLLRLSPSLPGRSHDLTTARTEMTMPSSFVPGGPTALPRRRAP